MEQSQFLSFTLRWKTTSRTLLGVSWRWWALGWTIRSRSTVTGSSWLLLRLVLRHHLRYQRCWSKRSGNLLASGQRSVVSSKWKGVSQVLREFPVRLHSVTTSEKNTNEMRDSFWRSTLNIIGHFQRPTEEEVASELEDWEFDSQSWALLSLCVVYVGS